MLPSGASEQLAEQAFGLIDRVLYVLASEGAFDGTAKCFRQFARKEAAHDLGNLCGLSFVQICLGDQLRDELSHAGTLTPSVLGSNVLVAVSVSAWVGRW
jgi:hypothetical protein